MTRPDNVTPFRPRRPPPKMQRSGNPLKSHRGKVLFVHAMTLAAFLCYAASRFYLGGGSIVSYVGLGFGIAAAAVAATNRREGMPWAVTHHEHALRTVVIGAASWMLASLLLFLPMVGAVVFYIMIGIAIWTLVRASVDFVLGIMRKPIPNPKSFLF
jgi:uncharacterized membrane protein